jgi:cellobiose phosphorylase
MYRLATESLLGVQRVGNTLRIEPLLPAHWPGFTLSYRFGATQYHFDVRRSDANVSSMSVDGQIIEGRTLRLIDDGVERRVRVECPAPVAHTRAVAQGVDH